MALSFKYCSNLRYGYSIKTKIFNLKPVFYYHNNYKLAHSSYRRYFNGINKLCLQCTKILGINPYLNKYSSQIEFSTVAPSCTSLLLLQNKNVDSLVYYSTSKNPRSSDSVDSAKSENSKLNFNSSPKSNIPSEDKSSNISEQTQSISDDNVVEKKLSLFQKFKTMYRDYWYVLLPVHCVSSVIWFGGFYLMAESGVDIVSILEYIGVSERLIEPFRNGHSHVTAGIIAVALALYKIATPLRYTVTLGGTTLAINYLKKWGYIKPIPKKEQLKAMYLERKDILLEKQQQLKSNMFPHLKDVDSTGVKRK